MKNLVLITSIINTPNIPLSYTRTRSIYTPNERYEQTKQTIETIRNKIPNVEIYLVECSLLNEEQNEYFIKNTNYFLNLYDNVRAKNCIYSISKSLGEGTMTFFALDDILNKDIKFDNLFKISGRYWLSDSFNYENFNNNNIVIKYINDDVNNVCTALYKLPYNSLENFKQFLINNFNNMNKCIGYEVLFANYIKTERERENVSIIHLNIIGVNGLISVSTDFCIS
jgi:hypothetical protein